MKTLEKIKSYKVGNWFMILISIFLLSMITGCVGEDLVPVTPKPIVPDPIVVKKGEASIYATPSSVVKYNGSATIYFVTKNTTDSVLFNGKKISVKDSIPFEFLTKDTTLSFTFTDKNGELMKREKMVEVLAPTKIDLMVDLLCLGSWQATKRETEKSPNVWEDTGLPENYKTIIWTYYLDETDDGYDPVNNVYVNVRSGNKYFFLNDGKQFSRGGKIYDLISLTEKELVLGFYFIVYSNELKKDVDGPRGRTTYNRVK